MKQLAPHPESGSHHRGSLVVTLFSVILRHFRHIGYSAPGREKVFHLKPNSDESDRGGDIATNKEVEIQKDIKESFEVGRGDDPVMPNIWYPDGVLPGFKDTCLDFFWVSLRGKDIKILFINSQKGLLRNGKATSKSARSRIQFI